MKFRFIIILITLFFIANVYYEGKLMKKVLSWRKYYQMALIGFVGFSVYMYMKKDPSKSREFLGHAKEFIKYMPLDNGAGDMLTPFLDFTLKNQMPMKDPMMDYNERRILESGGVATGVATGVTATKRSVSETKKKYVAASQNWKCGNCGKQLPAWFEVDHKMRLEHGGSNQVDNLVALCRDCHGEKTMMENL